MSRAVFSTLLLLNLYLAKVSIFDLGTANGFNDALNVYLEAEPLRFTTLKPLDSLLTLLLVPLYMLVIVEGMRFANRGRLITYPSIWGVTWRLIAIGVTLPCYFLAWIWTSPIPDAARTPEALAAAISVDQVRATAVTGAWLLGFILPSIALGLPSPRLISEHTQAVLLAFWQAFPIWTSAAHFLLARLVPKAGRDTPETKIARLNQMYSYALAPAALTFLGGLGFIYARAGTMAGLSPSELTAEVFRPTSPWSTAPAGSFEKGVLTLLQWDMYCSSAASWIWVAYVACAMAGVGRMVADVGKLVALSFLLGPGGAALAVVWGRDIAAVRAAAGSWGKKSG